MKTGHIHNIIMYMLALLPFAFSMASCDVHEFPEVPEKVQFYLKLKCDITAANITEWNHLYDGDDVYEQGLGETYDNTHEHGRIRYIVRAYPVSSKQRTSQEYSQEFVFEKELADGYDYTAAFDLAPGDYNIMVWADIVRHSGDTPFYNADNFAEITLQGEHQGNNDYRDAFRGTARVSLVADIMEREPTTVEIDLQRPLAKYEFVTTDLTEFISKEQTRAEERNRAQGETKSVDNAAPYTRVNIEDYKVVFYYVGFMPDTYSMFTDKPVDASTGVLFESKLKALDAEKASLGFDYVFVNGTESAVIVQIGIYDSEGTQLAMTNPIEVPLHRNHHTIVSGSFLLQEVSGGIVINPEFDGNHNVIVPNGQ